LVSFSTDYHSTEQFSLNWGHVLAVAKGQTETVRVSGMLAAQPTSIQHQPE